MSTLGFSPSEIRIATATLAAVAVIIPTVYLLCSEKSQESTPHLKTFRKYLRAYSSLRPAALTASASSEFSHTILPLSQNLPSRQLETFQKHASMIFSLFSDFRMIPQASGGNEGVHFSRETNTVIAHCKMGGKVNGVSEKGKILVDGGITEWWTECVLFVRLSEDGRRIIEIREFVDSKKAEELQKRLSGILRD